jgi:hypothetical protein
MSHYTDTDDYNIPYGNNPPRISQYLSERSYSQAPEVSCFTMVMASRVFLLSRVLAVPEHCHHFFSFS